MDTLIWILLATLFVSLLSLIGIITISLKTKILKKILSFLIALSAGALLGGAFIHLIPESLETTTATTTFTFLLIGFILFLLIEKILHWRHCHDVECKVHTFAYMSLFGDAAHNFIDGLIIAVSFMTNIQLGLTTTLAVTLHEIPQEIGDFGVLIHGGFSKLKALTYNFISALAAMAGGLIGFLLPVNNIAHYLIPIAAGGFIYISASDLIPELRKETNLKKSMLNLLVFIIGISIMYLI
ncbi:ZIP family metal transporter [Candidatus Woesearchaeota archaeon]|jgi:zinc and cadmium transporter|nr:ZIP family metal transporter [Candidatus Woesearchaeota archaeon]MBT4835488.1 ZIP family metal transporter [Candidatus Woesearchaeota archaeon]MBT6734820.1 ZIP family metal transporter [Candidatus Woesearchaeota archaeon]MBT7169833.1 ZIP family metal transporter [Candidatus Woesearchaeota archaeon]MBT7474623.1 ZIP family metal transporter [Candidatus Woesearchaeota archaeon]